MLGVSIPSPYPIPYHHHSHPFWFKTYNTTMPQLLFQQPPTIATSSYGKCCFAQSILAPQFTTTVVSWPQQVTTAASYGRRTFKCMASPRRVKMVANQIRREISDMLLTDKVLQFAVLPEAALGADRYLSSLTTISDVEVSGDLQVSFHLFYYFFPFQLILR